jgi:hypothetical protein
MSVLGSLAPSIWVNRDSLTMSARQSLAALLLYALLQTRLEAAPIWRYSVIAVQLRFLRAIAPVEILVDAE